MSDVPATTPLRPGALPVLPLRVEDEAAARRWAERLALELLPPDPRVLNGPQPWPLVLGVGPEGLQLISTGKGAPGPVQADFLTGSVAHRRRFGGGTGQQIARAVGIEGRIRPTVADLTAGLGRDSFVLATLGCEVEMVERAPVIAALLEDALARGRSDPEVGPILARMHLRRQEAGAWMRERQQAETENPQVIYLDPMFPHSQKSALVKKEMRVFRQVVGEDGDAGALLEQGLKTARCRVVVKRPRKAPALAGRAPTYSLEGKSGRFDIYVLRSLKPGRGASPEP